MKVVIETGHPLAKNLGSRITDEPGPDKPWAFFATDALLSNMICLGAVH